MATRNETNLAVRARVDKRVDDSASLVERMGLSVDQYKRVALNAFVTTPALAECTESSLDRAFMQCIMAGLMPDGKEAAIVPFNDRNNGTKDATLIPMVKGQLKLARRATPGLTLNVKAVYRDDDFDHDEGTQPRLYHKPNPTGARADTDIIAVYARALFPGASAWEFEVLYRSDIDRYRAYSRSSQE